ncbi:MAG: DUF4891 domain-containing protein [Bacteroides sp.]|nr:DUF4891 domain-containing protein [Bacteroides sp.]
MKSLLLIFMIASLFSACNRRAGGASVEADTAFVDTFPKATAIFWVDKHRQQKYNIPQGSTYDAPTFRTVKAKVVIDSIGRIKVISYVKPQLKRVEKYLQDRLEVFRVTKIMMDSGYIHPGSQYVQLRYMPDKMWE